MASNSGGRGIHPATTITALAESLSNDCSAGTETPTSSDSFGQGYGMFTASARVP
jgi:hypothetical protein